LTFQQKCLKSAALSIEEAGMATPADRAIELGAALRKRRKALGINMTAAAEAAGMHRATWHRLEQGETGVAWGLLLAAAAAVGLDLRFLAPGDGEGKRTAPAADALPLEIRLGDYPALRTLAWQIGEGVETLTPREAFGLYERNARHVDEAALMPHEKALLHGLRVVFEGARP
jgi:transcriptional regulator with XRE-family HTH domain